METKAEEFVLYGFVWRHGKEIMAKQICISKEDQEKIEQILMNYDEQGCSVMDASDCKLSEVF